MCLLFVTTTAEKPFSHKYEVTNGNKIFNDTYYLENIFQSVRLMIASAVQTVRDRGFLSIFLVEYLVRRETVNYLLDHLNFSSIAGYEYYFPAKASLCISLGFDDSL